MPSVDCQNAYFIKLFLEIRHDLTKIIASSELSKLHLPDIHLKDAPIFLLDFFITLLMSLIDNIEFFLRSSFSSTFIGKKGLFHYLRIDRLRFPLTPPVLPLIKVHS